MLFAILLAALCGVHGSASVKFDDKMSASWVVSEDQKSVSFTVTVDADTWMGIGVSPSGMMTNNGKGSDIVVCSNGTVQRYWVTKAQEPTGGVTVNGATCTQADGKSTMTFTRDVAANSATELPLNLAEATTFIWAYNGQSTDLATGHKFDGHQAVNLVPTPAAPTAAPTPASTTMHFDDKMSATYTVSADKKSVAFSVEVDDDTWFGLGVSPDGTMSGNGDGTDIIICTQGKVERFWVTKKIEPTGGVVVPGATCSLTNGKSTMTFTREVAANSNSERAIILDGYTNFIFAYNGANENLASGHFAPKSGKGNLRFDLVSGSGSATLFNPSVGFWLHMVFMGVAWGMVLPYGAAFARFGKGGSDASKWFRVHRAAQMTGWLMQIAGFVAILVTFNNQGLEHFTSNTMTNHAHMLLGLVVTILGTLQPLNAFFRPGTPHQNELKTTQRQCWEYLHKGSGWLAVLGGVANVALGVYIANEMQYVTSFWALGATLGGIGVLFTVGWSVRAYRASKNSGEYYESLLNEGSSFHEALSA